MNLTRNFTLQDMTHSLTAIRKGIDNTPTDIVIIRNLTYLCQHVLEPLRDYMQCPIRVSSGYRSNALNKAVGGSKSSQHCLGQAADLVVHGHNREMFEYIVDNLRFDQIIWEFGNDDEPDWVHVSYSSSGNKGQKLRAVKVNGKTKYLNL